MKTRIGRKMDISRLSSAVKRPGIDTRCWVSLAVALEDSFVDKDHGVFINVILMPTEEEYTARVGAEYAGGGFGFYAKILKDDELCVGTPSGDPGEGIVVLKRMWSAADLPPQQAIDDPEEVMVVVEPGKNARLSLSGGGQLRVLAGDNVVFITENIIELGAEGAADKAVLDSKLQTELARLKAELDAFKAIFDAHTHPDPNILPLIPLGPGVPVLAPTSPFPLPAVPGATNSALVTIDT